MEKEQSPSKADTAPDRAREAEAAAARSSNLDELAERLRATKGVDQDIAMLLAVNWQRLIWGLMLILVVVWLANYWKESRAKAVGRLAEQFQQMQTAYDGVINPPAPASTPAAPAATAAPATDPQAAKAADDAEKARLESIERSKKTFTDNVALLTEQGDGTYRELAKLYRAAAELEGGEFEAARSHLAPFNVEQYLARLPGTKSDEVEPERFLDEMASIIYLRLLLAEGKSDQAEIRSRLRTLVDHGQFVNVEALILLFRISSEPQLRDAAREAARSLAAAKPHLADTIRVELGNLGIELS